MIEKQEGINMPDAMCGHRAIGFQILDGVAFGGVNGLYFAHTLDFEFKQEDFKVVHSILRVYLEYLI